MTTTIKFEPVCCPGLLKMFVSVLLLVASFTAYPQSDQYKLAFSAYQTQDFISAETIWAGLAEQGNINAQYALGVMQLRGEAVNASPKKALSWFKKAAASGHTTAMFNVGVAYWEGSGVKKNRNKALKWWEKSAVAGDSGAQFNLGLAYYIGEERQADLELAARWIGMAAQQNHPESQRIYNILLQNNPQYASLSTPGADDQAAATNQANENSAPENTGQPASTEEIQSASTEEIQSASTEEIQPASTEEIQPASTEEIQSTPVTEYSYWKTAIEVTLNAQADSSSPLFYGLPQGTPVEVLEEKGGWSRVTLPDGLKMWVFENYLSVNGNKGVITGTGVRVRPIPSTDNTLSPPVGAYRNGDRVTILEHEGQWQMVRAPKHVGGWVKTIQLEKYQDSEENRDELWNLMIANGL